MRQPISRRAVAVALLSCVGILGASFAIAAAFRLPAGGSNALFYGSTVLVFGVYALALGYRSWLALAGIALFAAIAGLAFWVWPDVPILRGACFALNVLMFFATAAWARRRW